jgi:hypothetical protein
MIKLDDRYTPNPHNRFFYDFEHAAEETSFYTPYHRSNAGLDYTGAPNRNKILIIDHSDPIMNKNNDSRVIEIDFFLLFKSLNNLIKIFEKK